MTTSESKVGIPTSEKIPTLGEIIADFPPKEEMIETEEGTPIPIMVSRLNDKKRTILYAVPKEKWDSVKEHLLMPKELSQVKREA